MNKIKLLLLVMLISLTVQAGVGDLLQNIPVNIQRHPCWSAIAIAGIPTTCFLFKKAERYKDEILRLLKIDTSGIKSIGQSFDLFLIIKTKIQVLRESTEENDKRTLLAVEICSRRQSIAGFGCFATFFLTLYGWAKITGIKK